MKHYLPWDRLFSPYHSLFTWRDGVEIIFFSIVIYLFCVWLKKDNQKNLLGYFYAYCSCFFIAQALQLSTVSHLLFYVAPILGTLFIIFHQFTLQKNFVALRALTHHQPEQANWLETLIQLCLVAINKNKEIICIIEHIDSLRTYVTTPLALHADLTKDLLTILINSNSFNNQQMIWLNSHGKVLGINTQWHQLPEVQWSESTLNWKHDALFYTEKTDALVFKITPTLRLFDIVVHGKAYEQITAPHTISFITNYLTKPSSFSIKGTIAHGSQPYTAKKQSHTQHSH